MSRRFAATAAAASLAGLAALGMGAPAFAQTPTPTPTPPYSSTTSAGTSDETVVLGQVFTLTTGDGECDPNSTANVDIRGNGFSDTRTDQADASGTATVEFEVPDSARPGPASATFVCPLNGAVNSTSVGFTVVSSAAAAPAPGSAPVSGSGQLPRTGSQELISLSIGGAAMVALGAGIVIAARRRRESMPSGLA